MPDTNPPIIPDAPTGPLPKLTKSTPNPYDGDEHPDEPIVRSPIPYVYVDMRNQRWFAWWLGQGWIAKPTEEAAKFYGLTSGNTYAGADDARGLIDMVEANIERDRVNKQSTGGDGGGILLLLLLAAIVFDDNKRGKRR